MKVRKTSQYICSHCGKRGLSAGHMRRHEAHCTLNPKRECRMCEMANRVPRPMVELLGLLPDPTKHDLVYVAGDLNYSYTQLLIEFSMSALRDATHNCPACILATLRQAGIPVPMVESFRFAEESRVWLTVFRKQADRVLRRAFLGEDGEDDDITKVPKVLD